MGRLGAYLTRLESFRQAGKYVRGLLSDLPRTNCWPPAERAGDHTVDRMQRLLERASWNTFDAMDAALAKRRDGACFSCFIPEHTPTALSMLAVCAVTATPEPTPNRHPHRTGQISHDRRSRPHSTHRDRGQTPVQPVH